MPQTRVAGAGLLTWPRARATLYAVGLAVVVTSSTLGSAPLAGTSQPEDAPAEPTAESTEEEAVDPFVQEEVTFRYLPDAAQLLFGGSGEASATVLLATGCANGNKGSDLAMAKAHLVMTPSNPATPAQLLMVAPVDLSPSLPTGMALPAGGALPVCPVTLTTSEMSVGDSSRGWLLWVTPADAEVAPEQASVPYTVRRIIHWSGYVLLAATAVVLALLGALFSNASLYAESRQNTKGPGAKTEPLPNLPVMASVLGALSAVTAGALVWTDLVPGMDLGGIVVVGLIGGVLVAAGDRLSVTYPTNGGLAGTGLFLSLFGTVTIALLVPFVLLHGATLGWGSAVAWGLVMVLLGLASLVSVRENPKGPDEKEPQPTLAGGV